MPTFIGTSGWQYAHWRDRFYPRNVPSGRWLEHYAGSFATVELNNSFYRLPSAESFQAWADRTPDDFRFAVKASRYLTHVRRLREPAEPVDRLMAAAERLGRKLAVVLLQLPPTMRCEPERLEETLSAFPGGLRIAVEPRHRSWFSDEIRELLTRHGAALCLTDTRYRRSPIWRTADWTYLRLHQGRAAPPPCYGRAALAGWADRLAETWPEPADRYVFFNNDSLGCAIRDAAVSGRLFARRGLVPTRTPEARSVRLS